MPVSSLYRPAPRILSLGDGFWDVVEPARFPQHTLRYRNQRWAQRVGLAELDRDEWESAFARFEPLPDNLREPLALRYHGHQFGSYNPRLGDGRGFLFAQLLDGEDDRVLDLATKGSGRTPYHRGADGRLTLKGGIREVLASEMLEALGVYTSKAFSLFETGEALERHDEPSPTRASVLVRLGHSHIRFGSFQRHAHYRDAARVRELMEWCVAQYFPELSDAADLPTAFVAEVARRNAKLCASWMAAGFVHGVLNTDNMLVTGESFDYGPWRFLPTHDPRFTAAYFDQTGFYAFGRQPAAVRWNLVQLGEALQVAFPELDVEHALADYEHTLQSEARTRVLRRLGVQPRDPDTDATLVETTLEMMRDTAVGYAQLFHDWYGGIASEPRAHRSPEAERYSGPRFDAFRRFLAQYEPAHPERLEHPYFERSRPCDMQIDEVERLWAAVAEHDDWQPFEAKIAEIREMGDLLQLDPADST